MGLGVSVWAALCTLGASMGASAKDLSELSLEELSLIEITSVSKKEEPRMGAPAAIAVITGEDIRRSGVRSVPDALRMAPGLHVGRVSASSWAVSARGFSSVNSAKLLVLTDTRSIYTPLFSGVFWDSQDFLLEDVDRIEVIRGPGASLWGSNAVNGVINITTKSAKDTHGWYAEVGGGTEERAFGAVRYGGQWGEKFHYRLFAQYSNRDGGFLEPAPPSSDKWWISHVGLRADWDASPVDQLTFQGGIYRGDIGQVNPSVTIIGRPGPTGKLSIDVDGGNILARWRRQLGDDSDVQLRLYYDRTRRDDPTFLDELDTVDVDFQHRLPLPWRQELLWGAAYRMTSNTNRGKVLFELQSPDSRDHFVSGFLQDQISLLDSLRLTLGTKLEHNNFSGFEVQPNVRLAWDVSGLHTVWASVARAVRVPTRLERDVNIKVTDLSEDIEARLYGNDDFGSERLVAYELGHRWQAADHVLLDLALFYNRYHGLASVEFGDPLERPGGGTLIPLVNKNLTSGRAFGAEAVVTVSPFRSWRLNASYSFQKLQLRPGGEDLNRGRLIEGANPYHQVALQSFLDLPAHFQLDGLFRYASALRGSSEGEAEEVTGAYAGLDVRAAWRGFEPLEISVVGQNLLKKHHREFPGGTQVERGVYAKLALRL